MLAYERLAVSARPQVEFPARDPCWPPPPLAGRRNRGLGRAAEGGITAMWSHSQLHRQAQASVAGAHLVHRRWLLWELHRSWRMPQGHMRVAEAPGHICATVAHLRP